MKLRGPSSYPTHEDTVAHSWRLLRFSSRSRFLDPGAPYRSAAGHSPAVVGIMARIFTGTFSSPFPLGFRNNYFALRRFILRHRAFAPQPSAPDSASASTASASISPSCPPPNGLGLAFDSSGGTKIRSFPWTPTKEALPPYHSTPRRPNSPLPRSPKCPWRRVRDVLSVVALPHTRALSRSSRGRPAHVVLRLCAADWAPSFPHPSVPDARYRGAAVDVLRSCASGSSLFLPPPALHIPLMLMLIYVSSLMLLPALIKSDQNHTFRFLMEDCPV
ncbi:hypothetical protein K438DRAFT_1993793 [Mycena galopus ATCC 62051]|nr:hypothetical protein K438DRAFT_1993793 [Mycena galopus ATCC 62051]